MLSIFLIISKREHEIKTLISSLEPLNAAQSFTMRLNFLEVKYGAYLLLLYLSRNVETEFNDLGRNCY